MMSLPLQISLRGLARRGSMLRFWALLILLVAAKPALTFAVTCSPPPAIDPTRGFVANFNNPCYALPLATVSGAQESGDLNAIYDKVYFQVAPGYELVFLGVFPNSRFLLATVYDDHLVTVGNVPDFAMVPLASSMSNPFLTGATFKPNQSYGFKVTFGGGPPVNVSPGCSTASTNIDQNVMDASQIHQGLNWTGYPNLPPGFPPHETGANAAGVVLVRKYADIDSPPINEEVIVRSLANGCAIPIAQAIQSNIISTTQTLTSSWLHQTQVSAHAQFSGAIEPWECFPPDSQNHVIWMRTADYVTFENTYEAYLRAVLSAAQVQTLLSGQAYLRVQFQAPSTPNTPCTNGSCSLTGNEQARYTSFSIQAPAINLGGPVTLYSIYDRNFVKDPNGNVTLVIGFGAPQPANVTAANYYTWVDASTIPNISTLNQVRVRDLLPNQSFACSTFNVPYRTTEYNPEGGYLGNYVPTVDFPTAAQLPPVATPILRPNTCYIVPTETPQVCSPNVTGSSPARGIPASLKAE